MDALAVTDAATGMPVLRPLIGMDKEEIVEISRKIGTFDTSILPYEDCCTVFTPRHPKTKPTENEILSQVAKIDFDGLLDEAYATLYTETRRVDENYL
jgi:thiamine biosynthesis protein ThiI